MPTGTVKWFNNAKGYGFILPDNGDADVFAHYSAINMEGYRTLKAGQHVSYETVDGDKGSHAANINLVDATEGAGGIEGSQPNADAEATTALA